MGFGRFAVKAEAELVKMDDVLKRAEAIDTSDFCVKLISPHGCW